MRNLLILPLVFLCSFSYAQKYKTFDVCKGQIFHVSGRVSYVDNVASDTIYFVTGRDSRYQQLIEFILLREGELIDIYTFFNYCKGFLKNEETGISEAHEGNQLFVGKIMGMKYIDIYGINTDRSGYTQFATPQLNNILVGIEYFAKKRGILLK